MIIFKRINLPNFPIMLLQVLFQLMLGIVVGNGRQHNSEVRG